MDFGAYSTVAFVFGLVVGILSLWLLILAIVVGHRYLQMNPGRPVGVSVEDWIRVRMLASGATPEQLDGTGTRTDKPSH